MTEKSHEQENSFAQENFAELFEEYEKDSQNSLKEQ